MNKPEVVFTNGCFDILHLGHIKLLEYAHSLGSKLIIGINSDLSVKRLKGNDRPYFNQTQRRVALIALGVVDDVLIFKEDTPLKLIKKIHPDIIVKGSDYHHHEVVGKNYVESYGGEVHIMPLIQGYSSTSIINSMKKGINNDS